MSETKIEWTAVRAPDGTWVPGYTFNPWWGCVEVSPACLNCYARDLDKRWAGDHWGKDAPFRFFGDKRWDEPRRWNARAAKLGLRLRVFCGSMCDWLQDRPELEPHRARLLRLIDETPALDWLMLSKRPENLAMLTPWAIRGGAPANVMLGTTVEDQRRADERIPVLLAFPSLRLASMGRRFLSCEPLLGPVDLGLSSATCDCCARFASRWVVLHREVRSDWVHGAFGHDELVAAPGVYRAHSNQHGALLVQTGQGLLGIKPREFVALPAVDWVISGDESGHPSKVRETREEWHASLRDQCAAAGVAYFLKQTQDPTKPRGRVVSLPVFQGRQHRGQPGEAA
jgi:protein gp37